MAKRPNTPDEPKGGETVNEETPSETPSDDMNDFVEAVSDEAVTDEQNATGTPSDASETDEAPETDEVATEAVEEDPFATVDLSPLAWMATAKKKYDYFAKHVALSEATDQPKRAEWRKALIDSDNPPDCVFTVAYPVEGPTPDGAIAMTASLMRNYLTSTTDVNELAACYNALSAMAKLASDLIDQAWYASNTASPESLREHTKLLAMQEVIRQEFDEGKSVWVKNGRMTIEQLGTVYPMTSRSVGKTKAEAWFYAGAKVKASAQLGDEGGVKLRTNSQATLYVNGEAVKAANFGDQCLLALGRTAKEFAEWINDNDIASSVWELNGKTFDCVPLKGNDVEGLGAAVSVEVRYVKKV